MDIDKRSFSRYNTLVKTRECWNGRQARLRCVWFRRVGSSPISRTKKRAPLWVLFFCAAMGLEEGDPNEVRVKKCPGDIFLARGRVPMYLAASRRDVDKYIPINHNRNTLWVVFFLVLCERWELTGRCGYRPLQRISITKRRAPQKRCPDCYPSLGRFFIVKPMRLRFSSTSRTITFTISPT